MTGDTVRFDEVGYDAWRARVEKDGTSVAALAHAGLEGIDVQALYDRGPCVPLVMPPRSPASPTIELLPAGGEVCDGTAWHDAGATAVDEVAIVLAGVIAALRDGARPTMYVALGGDLLLELAKLRALRGLWHACAQQLGVPTGSVRTLARTGRRIRSRLDVDTNLVRATYELFAAVCAGVDGVVVEPHDRAGAGSEASQRWARNLVELMRHESRLADVDDPFAGSWAIESLTRALAEAAWTRVQSIEQAGGLAAVIADGSLARDVAAAAERRRAAVTDGTHPIVGVSKFPPLNVVRVPIAEDPTHVDLCRPYEDGGAA